MSDNKGGEYGGNNNDNVNWDCQNFLEDGKSNTNSRQQFSK